MQKIKNNNSPLVNKIRALTNGSKDWKNSYARSVCMCVCECIVYVPALSSSLGSVFLIEFFQRLFPAQLS